MIGDIACDPGRVYNSVPVHDRATDRQAPAVRVDDALPLDVVATDDLPSQLPVDASEDCAGRLLPALPVLDRPVAGVRGWAGAAFATHMKGSDP